MRGLMKQTGNELLKIWHQLGYRILLFVIAGAVLCLPAINFTFNLLSNLSSDYNDYFYDDADSVWGEYINCQNEYSSSFFSDNELPDWKQSLYELEVLSAGLRVRGLELMISGKYKCPEVLDYFYMIEVSEVCDTDGTENADDYRYDYEWIAEHYSRSKAEESYREALSTLDAIEARVIGITVKEAVKEYLDDAEDVLTEAEAALVAAKSVCELETNDENTRALRVAQTTYDVQKLITEGWRYAYDHECEPFGWEFNILYSCMPSAGRNMISAIPNTERQYEASPEYTAITGTVVPYGLYVAECERSFAYYEEALKTYHVAVLNNAPMSEAEEISTKGGIRDTLLTFVDVMNIFMIVLVAGIISSEFSSGTVRLLLIRPRSRIQIITAKLLAALAVYIGSVTVMTVLLTFEQIVFCGIGDVFTGDAVSFLGAVFVIPGIFMLIGKVIVASMPVLLLSLVAAVFAVLTRKNAVAIVLALLAYLSASTVKTVVYVIIMISPAYMSWIVYTPFAYTDLVGLVPPAVAIIGWDEFNINSFLTDMMSLVPYGANLGLGIVYYIIGIAILVFLTLLIFKKRQIKN